MRLTIIPADGFVSIDNLNKTHSFDLSDCGIPVDVHALQWYDNKGWIEFSDDGDPFTPKQANEMISKLPDWANNCVQVWNNWKEPEITYPEPVIEYNKLTLEPITTVTE